MNDPLFIDSFKYDFLKFIFNRYDLSLSIITNCPYFYFYERKSPFSLIQEKWGIEKLDMKGNSFHISNLKNFKSFRKTYFGSGFDIKNINNLFPPNLTRSKNF